MAMLAALRNGCFLSSVVLMGAWAYLGLELATTGLTLSAVWSYHWHLHCITDQLLT